MILNIRSISILNKWFLKLGTSIKQFVKLSLSCYLLNKIKSEFYQLPIVFSSNKMNMAIKLTEIK